MHTLDGSTKVGLTIASPVFQTSDVGAAASATASAPPSFSAGRTVTEPSDVTQVADAVYRAQWGKTGSGYHVLLGRQPSVLPTQSFTVPQNLGQIVETDDPVGGYAFEITLGGVTYDPEDETHFSWFAHEIPSRAASGYYTYLNNFPTIAQGCR